MVVLVGMLAPGMAWPVTRYPNRYDAEKAATSCELHAWNVEAFTAVYARRTPALDVFFTLLLWFGKGWVLAPVVAWLAWRRRALLWPLGLAVGVETLAVQALKHVYDIPRPAAALPGVLPLERVYAHAYPSGDVAMVCAILFSLWPAFPGPARVGAVVFAALIALERVYVAAHFPLDVVAGAAVGLAGALLAHGVLDLRRPASLAE
jgi:undecaprenyl-diphosphatase